MLAVESQGELPAVPHTMKKTHSVLDPKMLPFCKYVDCQHFAVLQSCYIVAGYFIQVILPNPVEV